LFAVAPVFGLTGSMEALVLWYNRKRFYRRISLNRVISAVSAASYKTAHPFSGPIHGNGLIMGHILGQILGFAHLVYRSGLGLFQANWQEMRVTFKLYRQFAIFAAPAALLNILAIRMPEFLISSFDGQEATGFYGNASKLTYLPMSLLAMAVSQVFFERIARIRNDKKASAEMSGQLFNFLVYFGIVPVALVAVWGDKIFPLVLGSEWTTSGVYAQILIFFYFSMFLTSSFSSAFEAYNKLRVQLLYNGSFLLLTAGAMLWSYLNNYDTLTALTVFTIVGVSLRLGIINYFFHLFGKRLLFKTILVILATAGLVILLMYIRSRF
jgi:O-antigen/teichoic acid export membrane protein